MKDLSVTVTEYQPYCNGNKDQCYFEMTHKQCERIVQWVLPCTFPRQTAAKIMGLFERFMVMDYEKISASIASSRLFIATGNRPLKRENLRSIYHESSCEDRSDVKTMYRFGESLKRKQTCLNLIAEPI